MRKYQTISLMALAFGCMISLNGCILDALNTLTQNIPISQTFTITNSTKSTDTQTETIDLSNSSTYQRYSGKIDSIKFAQAEFRTENVSPSSLSANVSITLKDSNGNILFTYPLGPISPADYQNTPYQLSLTSPQIKLINAYLSTLTNKKFIAELDITNVSPTPYSLTGDIDIVFQMTAKTN